MGLPAPALVEISHGTSSAVGQAVVRQLVDDVAGHLQQRAPRETAPDVRLGHVDVQHDQLIELLAHRLEEVGTDPDQNIIILGGWKAPEAMSPPDRCWRLTGSGLRGPGLRADLSGPAPEEGNHPLPDPATFQETARD